MPAASPPSQAWRGSAQPDKPAREPLRMTPVGRTCPKSHDVAMDNAIQSAKLPLQASGWAVYLGNVG